MLAGHVTGGPRVAKSGGHREPLTGGGSGMPFESTQSVSAIGAGRAAAVLMGLLVARGGGYERSTRCTAWAAAAA